MSVVKKLHISSIFPLNPYLYHDVTNFNNIELIVIYELSLMSRLDVLMLMSQKNYFIFD